MVGGRVNEFAGNEGESWKGPPLLTMVTWERGKEKDCRPTFHERPNSVNWKGLVD